MTPPLAGSALGAWSLSSEDIRNIAFVTAGLVVFIVFLVASRLIAHLIAEQLRHRAVRPDMIVLGRRVVYVVVIGIGITAAIGFAVQSANVTLVGILLATVVAALGVQDLLRDYVSGYYLLLERHIRVGDRIVLDGHTGEVVEVKLRVSLVRTAEGDLLVVPNSELFTRPVLVRAKGSPEEHAAKEADAAKPSEHQG
ncbi:MAG TPA: mechanosensitive ion channel domain-containing protein [Candidatus Dormibacteraeota bacterium]|nr:mechanosensitive ion channel domain-containing protein [Candidatus Dormibacteraeota bacterium]